MNRIGQMSPSEAAEIARLRAAARDRDAAEAAARAAALENSDAMPSRKAQDGAEPAAKVAQHPTAAGQPVAPLVVGVPSAGCLAFLTADAAFRHMQAQELAREAAQQPPAAAAEPDESALVPSMVDPVSRAGTAPGGTPADPVRARDARAQAHAPVEHHHRESVPAEAASHEMPVPAGRVDMRYWGEKPAAAPPADTVTHGNAAPVENVTHEIPPPAANVTHEIPPPAANVTHEIPPPAANVTHGNAAPVENVTHEIPELRTHLDVPSGVTDLGIRDAKSDSSDPALRTRASRAGAQLPRPNAHRQNREKRQIENFRKAKILREALGPAEMLLAEQIARYAAERRDNSDAAAFVWRSILDARVVPIRRIPIRDYAWIMRRIQIDGSKR